MNVYTTYTRPLSVRAQHSRKCPIISSNCYNSSLVTWTVVCLTAAKSKPCLSLSHIATDGLSVCLSWYRAPSGAHDQIFVTVWQFLFCLLGAPSLTRGCVCLLSESVSSNKSVSLASGKVSCYNVSANRVEVTPFNSILIAFLAVTVLWTVRCRGYRRLISYVTPRVSKP
jgi:hypothetical protein